MKLPVSWLKDFVDTDGLTVEDIARTLTLAGLEVNEVHYAGLAMPKYAPDAPLEFKTSGISWDREKIVVAEIREVKAHPNADRLTLLDLFDGEREHIVLTGAPNIFHLKGTGPLNPPLKVAYAKEGATLYDGHAEGLQLTVLKRAKIRGVDSYSMVCSEKELGIAEEHDGIILLDAGAQPGMPLADLMGDAVLDIDILPNMARNACVMGVARELAALTGRKLRVPTCTLKTTGAPVTDAAEIRIADPNLNPRFVLGLIRNVKIQPSPYEVQRRLKLAGMRPINAVVDATNYAMLELGQPLHAFDMDALQARAGKGRVAIQTRNAKPGERMKTLDGMERALSPENVLVCDSKGPVSVAGVMGGSETEVGDSTRNVLLEGAAWDFINIRKTARQHNLLSEAAFRFSRGVHPALAPQGVELGLRYMAEWAGGSIAPGRVDQYPRPPAPRLVTLSTADVRRLLGISLTGEEICAKLGALGFTCVKKAGSETIVITAPDHRMDIGEGVIGRADILEELARLVGFERIPSSLMADALPPQLGNPRHDWEERLKDTLTSLGLDEVVGYRMTSEAAESRICGDAPHARIANPIAPEKSVLRCSLVASVLDNVERNLRLEESICFFEVGPVFQPIPQAQPAEERRLAFVMTGLREAPGWRSPSGSEMDFYDAKGVVESLLSSLHLHKVAFAGTQQVRYLHPGKAAEILVSDTRIGVVGELHPAVAKQYELGKHPVLICELDLGALAGISQTYRVSPLPEYPPIREDIAVIVDEAVPATHVDAVIRDAGGAKLVRVQLFDVYRGEQIGTGKKSMAFELTYQEASKTMTDAEAAAIRNRIVHSLQKQLGATLRS